MSDRETVTAHYPDAHLRGFTGGWSVWICPRDYVMFGSQITKVMTTQKKAWASARAFIETKEARNE